MRTGIVLTVLSMLVALSTAGSSTTLRRGPIDCQMVRAINPKFHSDMPVIPPTTRFEFPMRVIRPVPCKG